MQQKILELIEKGVTTIPDDVHSALKTAYKKETNKIAKREIGNILENIRIAKHEKVPLCQDVGLPVFYVYHEYDARIERDIRTAVKTATEKNILRPNCVNPITRENIGNIPMINWVSQEADKKRIIFFPKGAGSENMSFLRMLMPNEGVEKIKNFVIECVRNAGANPCPPIIVGVGIGSNFDGVTALAKKAILRRIDKRNSDRMISNLENELLEEINKLGIGPMGLGGKTTALGVNIEADITHTAMLPVAVNIQCWAARKSSMDL